MFTLVVFTFTALFLVAWWAFRRKFLQPRFGVKGVAYFDMVTFTALAAHYFATDRNTLGVLAVLVVLSNFGLVWLENKTDELKNKTDKNGRSDN